MKVKVLADGALFVEYGFVHLDSGVGGWDQDVDQRAGQRNGLAGGAQDGFVLLTTGTHTGHVPLRIELYRKAPPLDERWDEVVEVSCDLRGRRLVVTSFDDELDVRKLRQNGPHRVRYSALRFDDEDERRGRAVALDRYLVQLWPAPPAPDEVVKQTSEGAAYWHELAREAGAGPSLPERAATERVADQREKDRLQAEERAWERELTLFRWGGRDPSARLRALDPAASTLAIHHRDLVDVVEALTPDRQRRLALEVARRTCGDDHDSPVDWTPALMALEQGLALPAPFHDADAIQAAMFGADPEVSYEGSYTIVASVAGCGPTPPPVIFTGISAAAAVRGASDPDPLAAALRTIEAASWSARDEDAFFTEVTALLR